MHQRKQEDNLPLDLCIKNITDVAERKDLAKQAEGYRHCTAIKLAFNLSFTRHSIFLRKKKKKDLCKIADSEICQIIKKLISWQRKIFPRNKTF